MTLLERISISSVLVLMILSTAHGALAASCRSVRALCRSGDAREIPRCEGGKTPVFLTTYRPGRRGEQLAVYLSESRGQRRGLCGRANDNRAAVDPEPLCKPGTRLLGWVVNSAGCGQPERPANWLDVPCGDMELHCWTCLDLPESCESRLREGA